MSRSLYLLHSGRLKLCLSRKGWEKKEEGRVVILREMN